MDISYSLRFVTANERKSFVDVLASGVSIHVHD